MQEYKATYYDQKGKEEICVKSDGSTLYTTIREIDFEGMDFEILTGKIDHSKFEYDFIDKEEGDIINLGIEVHFPITLYNKLTNTTTTEKLIAFVEVGKLTNSEKFPNTATLEFKASFGSYISKKKIEWFEDSLIEIQKQLPKHLLLKTCLSCKFSHYSPYGNGMYGHLYCFKKIKEEIKKVKDKKSLLELWTKEKVEAGIIENCQETYKCEQHSFITKDDWNYSSWEYAIKQT